MPSSTPASVETTNLDAIHEALRAWPADHNLVLPSDAPPSAAADGEPRRDPPAAR